MNMQWVSSPYSLTVTIATVTKVKSKIAMSIKLKDLSLYDMTRVQLTNSSFYIWVESGAFCAEHKTDGSGSGGEKLNPKLSYDTQLIYPSL